MTATAHKSAPAWFALKLLRAYQILLSPLLGSHCRHFPSCSEYSRQAIERFGVLRGGWLTVTRLSRCHPWGSGGFDPVPEVYPASASRRTGS